MAHLAGRDVLCNEAQERHHGQAACVAAQTVTFCTAHPLYTKVKASLSSSVLLS